MPKVRYRCEGCKDTFPDFFFTAESHWAGWAIPYGCPLCGTPLVIAEKHNDRGAKALGSARDEPAHVVSAAEG